MAWQWVLGSAALSIWAVSTLVSVVDYHRDLSEQRRCGQLRVLYGILRLLDGSPPGLITAEFKTVLCQYIRQAFQELQQQHGKNSGYQACIDAADQQLQTLQRRQPAALPAFRDPARISAGNIALPRFRSLVTELKQIQVISSADASKFIQQLKDRQCELDADTATLRGERAQQANDRIATIKHFTEARHNLRQVRSSIGSAQRLEAVNRQLAQL